MKLRTPSNRLEDARELKTIRYVRYEGEDLRILDELRGWEEKPHLLELAATIKVVNVVSGDRID